MKTEEQIRQRILDKYSYEMGLIKLRMEQIRTAENDIPFYIPMVEYRALQFRKIIEQILLASLVTNSEKYKEYYDRLEKEWNPKYIARDLKRINSNFFPKAVIDHHDQHQLENREDCLTCDELIEMYKHIGRLLHANNPFSQLPDYEAFSMYIINGCSRIIDLLNFHTIMPYGEKVLLFVIMHHGENGEVSINWCEKCDE